MPEINLHVDGPHSPERTKEIADLLAECVRFLNYATMSGNGLTDPADVYYILGALYTGTQRASQLFGQVATILDRQAADGVLADNAGGVPAELVADAALHLGDAQQNVDALTNALQNAQQAISGLYAMGGPDA
jgi:hypothetical protein